MTEQTTRTELLPCPFCGADAYVYPVSFPKSLRYSVQCEYCAVGTPNRGAEAEAIAAWNQRTRPAIPGDVVEALRTIAGGLTYGPTENTDWKAAFNRLQQIAENALGDAGISLTTEQPTAASDVVEAAAERLFDSLLGGQGGEWKYAGEGQRERFRQAALAALTAAPDASEAALAERSFKDAMEIHEQTHFEDATLSTQPSEAQQPEASWQGEISDSAWIKVAEIDRRFPNLKSPREWAEYADRLRCALGEAYTALDQTPEPKQPSDATKRMAKTMGVDWVPNPTWQPSDGLVAELEDLPELPSGMVGNFTPSLRDRILSTLNAAKTDEGVGLLREAKDLVRESQYHLRIDMAARNYHEKAEAFLPRIDAYLGEQK